EEVVATKEEETPAATSPHPGNTTSGEKTTRRGKLDESTLKEFGVIGVNNLSCAEAWIARAERVAREHNLSHGQLCTAVCERATGEVKTFVDSLTDDSQFDGPKLCDLLVANFGRAARQLQYHEELADMSKIVGLGLEAAVDRIRKLMTETNQPPEN